MAYGGRFNWYAEINVGTEAVPSWYLLPPGILKNFRCTTDATSKSGSGTFSIADKKGTLWDTLDDLSNDGVNQELQFYFGDTTTAMSQVFGGYINRVNNLRNRIQLDVDHYMQLLTREVANGDNFQEKTGSYMVSDITATKGLIPLYFPVSTTGVVPIGYTNHVDLTGSQTGEEFTFSADNMNLLSALKQIAQKTRKTLGAIPYDFYVDYCPTHAAKEIWFDVKNATSFASGVTLYSGSDFFDSYKLDEELSNLVNYWTIKGENKTVCPIDQDWWTDKATDAEVQAICKIVNTTNGSGTERTTTRHAGSSANKFDFVTADGNNIGYVQLNSTHAYDSEYTPKLVSGSGFKLDDSADWRLSFSYHVNRVGANDGGNGLDIFFAAGISQTTPSDETVRLPIGVTASEYVNDTTNGFTTSTWIKVELLLQDILPSSKYVGKYFTSFIVGADVTGSPSQTAVIIDRLHFARRDEIVTSTPTVTPYPGVDDISIGVYGRRKSIFNDRNITELWQASPERLLNGNTQEMCNTIASRLVGMTASPSLTFTAQLKKYFAISPMKTFTLNIPERGVVGETYRCNQMTYTPSGQTLQAKPASFYDDSNYDIGTVVSQIKRNLDEAARR